jgi:hypothetical protein
MPPKADRRIRATPTGIEMVDRVLAERAPFASIDEAESMAARLMARWRTLTTPSASDGYAILESRRRK